MRVPKTLEKKLIRNSIFYLQTPRLNVFFLYKNRIKNLVPHYTSNFSILKKLP